jgi:hypothetical protein
MQTDATSQQKLAKAEFERHALNMGVTVKKYHADNGRFIDNAWTEHIKLSNQSMSLCGVNAHHQNGKMEKRIRDLQELSRSSLLHAQKLWPDAINTFLWPYAVRKASHDMSLLKRDDNNVSTMEKLSNTNVNVNIKHFHMFGCPMYVLDAHMKGPIKGPKWNSRARLAVYIGNSEKHARSIGLALSMQTGLVSPGISCQV